ncbi:MAG: FHA domain-containing protein [Zetaproteobacteria bacterium]|nr:MAG: FHA domain-containing protein [Zetaproteobacteria bacterium]
MGARLILKFRDAVIGEYPLEHEETTIGRKPGNIIQIDNLAVSGRHARIIRVGSKAILEDLNSTNGTYVNGERITKHVLKHGDKITVGKHTLIYVETPDEKPAPPPKEEDDLEKTVVLTPEKAQAAAGVRPSATSQTKTKLPLGVVNVLSGPMSGRSVELTAALSMIGKGNDCKVRVGGFMVGKHAAAISRRPSGYFIAYVEGFSKPKVNGETVDEQPRQLKDGDVIEVGDTKMEFFIKEPA